MISWPDFREARPDLAEAGRALFYQWDIGLGFLATVRKDGGPRGHPICPVINDDGCFGLIIPGPKLEDLRRDPRYALHSETCPPPCHDDAFSITGYAVEHHDQDLWNRVADQFLAERKLDEPWPDFDAQVLIEFNLARCLLTLTEESEQFPKGHTVFTA